MLPNKMKKHSVNGFEAAGNLSIVFIVLFLLVVSIGFIYDILLQLLELNIFECLTDIRRKQIDNFATVDGIYLCLFMLPRTLVLTAKRKRPIFGS